ncbi:hypothetical protein EJ08DRAFT_678078 [Tothia fuscella]|uniref:DUF7703 domain-containing protein n=1 Tax=Tothia fuscella TaxID=1048955 RepID=A0A9P4NUI7_9PEZI|nr:hypothetical protein EJ08DRAFT_678078 [Tothia fuscella]
MNSTVEDPCRYVPLAEYDWTRISLSSTCHGNRLPFNPTVWSLNIVLHSLSTWFALEIILKTFCTFRRWKSLYFWSLNTTALGIIIHSVSQDIPLEEQIGTSPGVTLAATAYNLGWIMMVSGFSLILLSRLHLILPNPRLLRLLLVMIIVVGFVIHTPIFLMTYIRPKLTQAVTFKLLFIVSHFDIVFSIQEIILSSLYIYHFFRFYRQGGAQGSQYMRRTMHLLIMAEIVVVATDIILNALLYTRLYLIRRLMLGLLYAVKLKVEFLVLNRLVKVGRRENTLGQDFTVDHVSSDKHPRLCVEEVDLQAGLTSQPGIVGMSIGLTTQGPDCMEGAGQQKGTEGPTALPESISPGSMYTEGLTNVKRDELTIEEYSDRLYMGQYQAV